MFVFVCLGFIMIGRRTGGTNSDGNDGVVDIGWRFILEDDDESVDDDVVRYSGISSDDGDDELTSRA